MALRRLAKRLFLRLGYDVRRASAASSIDPWLAMQSLFGHRPVRTIVDVGAHIGDYTERFLFFFPQAEIYAFEPTPASFQTLQQRFLKSGRVHAFPIALADYEGSSRFFINADSVTNSLLPATDKADLWSDTPGACAKVDTITSPVTTLGRFCEENNISSVDILKIDAQGADLIVLKGGERLLRRGGVTAVLAELTFVPIYSGQGNGEQIIAFLEKFGYRIYNLFALRNAPNGRLKWCDGLFVHEGFLGETRASRDATSTERSMG